VLCEPPYTERYVRWCEGTVGKLIIYLLLDLNSDSPAKKAGEGGVDMGVIWNSEFEKTFEKYLQLHPYNPEFEEALKKMRDLRHVGTC